MTLVFYVSFQTLGGEYFPSSLKTVRDNISKIQNDILYSLPWCSMYHVIWDVKTENTDGAW